MSSKAHASLRPSLRDLATYWWPVGVWLVIIRLESTNYASSANTGRLLSGVLDALFGNVDPQAMESFNAVARKSGHFLGYAILSLLVFLALKYTNRARLMPVLSRRWGAVLRDLWQWDWAVVAVLFTLVTAAFDEMHQAFLPSRTGRWQDVALDTSGALLMQLVVYARAARSNHLQPPAAQRETIVTGIEQ